MQQDIAMDDVPMQPPVDDVAGSDAGQDQLGDDIQSVRIVSRIDSSFQLGVNLPLRLSLIGSLVLVIAPRLDG